MVKPFAILFHSSLSRNSRFQSDQTLETHWTQCKAKYKARGKKNMRNTELLFFDASQLSASFPPGHFPGFVSLNDFVLISFRGRIVRCHCTAYVQGYLPNYLFSFQLRDGMIIGLHVYILQTEKMRTSTGPFHALVWSEPNGLGTSPVHFINVWLYYMYMDSLYWLERKGKKVNFCSADYVK